MREHLNRPTWLVEEPAKPLEEGHLSWSHTLQEIIQPWTKIRLEGTAPQENASSGRTTTNIGQHKRIKL